jgi:predicted amidohydrolase YtcJ
MRNTPQRDEHSAHANSAAAHIAGYAFEFALEPGSGRIMCTQKDGVNAGVEGVLRYYPDTGTVVAILTNQDCDVWNMANDVHEALKKLSIS